jgi:regulatory associated protein of mTOR
MLQTSLDGDVKLWDLRGHNSAAQTWNLHPQGLSAFDVHLQTGVFATCVNLPLLYSLS